MQSLCCSCVRRLIPQIQASSCRWYTKETADKKVPLNSGTHLQQQAEHFIDNLDENMLKRKRKLEHYFDVLKSQHFKVQCVTVKLS